MQISADLEGTTCGPYGGCVGYFRFNGNLEACITIRTAVLKERQSLRPSRRRLGERLRTRSGISGNGKQKQSYAQSRGAGGDVRQNAVAANVSRLKPQELKARNMTARGEAPGSRPTNLPSPARATQQGWNLQIRLATVRAMSPQPNNIFAGTQVVALLEVRGPGNSLARAAERCNAHGSE